MSREQSFDPKCYDLAKHFLSETSDEILRRLAQTIQDAVEGFGYCEQCKSFDGWVIRDGKKEPCEACCHT